MTWGPTGVYFFIRGRRLPFRVLSTLKFYGCMNVSDLASRFSTTEGDIESAIIKLKLRREPIQFDKETRELIYIPLKEFTGAMDVAYGSEKYTLFFTSNRVIVSKITRDELHKLEHVSQENILKADERNFAIPYSEIVKVEIKKKRLGGKIYVTDKETYEFDIRGSEIFGHQITQERNSLMIP